MGDVLKLYDVEGVTLTERRAFVYVVCVCV